MLLVSSLLLALVVPARAEDPTLPNRPVTYPVAGPFTEGVARNFRELVVDPQALVKDLKPVAVRKVKRPPAKRPRVLLTRTRFEISEKIFFELNSAEIKSDSFSLLDEVAKVLVEHPEVLLVSIEGHTDNRGNDAANMKLSDQRAASVKAYLEGKGVDGSRLESHGYGETRPLLAEENEAAWEKNRRVEFVVAGLDPSKGNLPEDAEAAMAARAVEETEPGMPATSSLPIENEYSSFADISINGTAVGIVGPMLNGSVDGVKTGFYDITYKYQNGYTQTRRVHTIVFDGPLVPGGEEARATLDSGYVPTWAADQAKGLVEDTEPEAARLGGMHGKAVGGDE